MHSQSNNTEFMTYDDLNDAVEERLESLLLRYQLVLEISVGGSNF